MIVTRFAPSPTGYLHLGHAYSAFKAYDAAYTEQGKFLLRIEDIDPIRCKPGFADDMIEDLRWLGLEWPTPVRYQAQHFNDYQRELDRLRSRGLVYPCFCTRRNIVEAASAVNAPHLEGKVGAQELDGPVYPGTCRKLSVNEAEEKMQSEAAYCWRLDTARAKLDTGELFWHDRIRGEMRATPEIFGDVVLARKDVPTSYHLSVTVDDHLQGVTLITRGEDLFAVTHIHRLLQALLGYEVPEYAHHDLLRDANGKRFAKRDRSATLRALREAGKSPGDIMLMIGRK